MPKNILIIGGGFAGLQLARGLKNTPYNITLIDKVNYHQFQPLFYQVATARLEPSNISFPFRKIFQKARNLQFRLAEVMKVNPVTNTVETTTGDFHYDYLVFAQGCTTNFFGNEEIKKKAFAMKSTQDAITIRNNILLNLEAIFSASEKDKEALMQIVIVGGGPTGVELAGAFAEMRQYNLPKDYPGVDFSAFKIFLLEGSPNTLNNMSDPSRKKSRQYLKEMGVIIRTQTVVKEYDGETVTLANGETIRTKNFIWAAGVTGMLIDGINPSAIEKGNRYTVDRYNKINSYNNIYAIGDIALMHTPNYPQGHPQLANVAINQAKNLAANLKGMLKNKPLKEYEYKDLGTMATVGKNKAVVDLPFIKYQGFFAWLSWMFLHLMLILSIRNKVGTFINWAWSYITKDTTLRLILKSK